MFRYSEVEDFLRRAKEQTNLFSLKDWNGRPGIVLRHDVDLDVLPAWQLAQVEKRQGVRSSYFFLLSSDFYNIASHGNRRLVREMKDDGFDIGLHFDPLIYPGASDEELERKARKEAEWLSDIVGTDVNSISMHNPDAYGRIPIFPTFLNAYDSRIFSTERYSSDSRMIFRTAPDSLLEIARTQTAQINLHPEHYSETGGAYPECQVAYIERCLNNIHTQFLGNAGYAKIVTAGLQEHVVKHLSPAHAR